MSLIEVQQDDYLLIRNHAADKNVYVTRGVGNCFVFGITFADDHGSHAIFAHYNPKYWTPGYDENERFAVMRKELEGKRNITIEVVTAMMEATKKTTAYATSALPGADSINFYYASPGKGGAVDVYFFPTHAVLWADPTVGSLERRAYNDESAKQNINAFDQHVTPRACADIITKQHTKTVTCRCILM